MRIQPMASVLASFALALTAGAGPAVAAPAAPQLTQVMGQVVKVPAHGSALAKAVCFAGQTAISGGWYRWTYNVGVTPGESWQARTSLPGDTWVVVFENPSGVVAEAGAIAYCTP
ncbi:hypothetical protein [Streptomyces sp. NPDC093225]|uniref:hypothetical protein n=1 Tax=Streptomyces sp. NPDC093225 TaxID=3366034 RepID=UPI0038126C91